MVNTAKAPRAYSEVYSFINALGPKYKEKIPSKIYNTIEKNRDKEYNPVIKADQTIQKGMISQEALAIISALNLQYWCTNEEEKNSLKKAYIENAAKEKEKYSYDNLFKNGSTSNNISNVNNTVNANNINSTNPVSYENSEMNQEVSDENIAEENEVAAEVSANSEEKNTMIVEYKEGIVTKILNFFKNLFNKKLNC